MEYAIYPFNEMRITQRHDEGNHKPHWYPSTNYSDKPWDEACKDGGRSYFVPGNDYIVDEVIRSNRSMRLTTLNEVKVPYQDQPVKLHITLTHMKEEDLKKVYQGEIVRKGTQFILEGDEGGAYGYHFHCTANIGRYYGLLQNSNGKWCFTYDKALVPDEAFYIDESKTEIYNANGYNFKKAEPQPIPPTPSDYPFEGIVKKGSALYDENGNKYPNETSCDREVRVEGELNGRYKVYGSTFNPHIVYTDKGNVTKKGTGYPFSGIVKAGSTLYDENGKAYPNKCKSNRKVTVEGEVNNRYKVYGSTFNPHTVYVDKGSIKA